MALVTKMRSPHTIGLDTAIPGIGVFQRTFLPPATSHSLTAPWPSPLPLALSPRKAGHGRAAARVAAGSGAGAAGGVAGAAVPDDAAGGGPVGVPGASRCSGKVWDPCEKTTFSIRPPRPPNVNVRPSTSATRKAV